MLTALASIRLPSRQLIRGISSSTKRFDHFLNVDQKVFRRKAFSVYTQNSTLRLTRYTSVTHLQGFEKALQVKDKVVIVDFYADWCGPCKVLGPILERVTKDETLTSASGKPFDLVTVDTDALVELAVKYEIRALPTVVSFEGGEPGKRLVGAHPESKVTEFLKSL